MKIYHTVRNRNLLFLAVTLILTACQTAPSGKGAQDAAYPGRASALYIDPTKTIFPLDNYPQSVDKWLPAGSDANTPLMDEATQQKYFAALKTRYFGLGRDENSPWNAAYIASVLKEGPEAVRDASVNQLLSDKSVLWGQNFRPHSARWKTEVRGNADTEISHDYHPAYRAIAIRETLVRVLPTDDPAFDDYRLAGQGYPFDNLQMSSIRPGVPVYILTTSRDERWRYVCTPTVTGWVHSEDVAPVSQGFVTEWVAMANRNLGAIIRDSVSVADGSRFFFTARPGTILPFRKLRPGTFQVAVPTQGRGDSAERHWVTLDDNAFVSMPWQMVPGHLATLLRTMGDRPYGWGNNVFHNDCSAELRSLLMPFGIFLPRNSAAQIQSAARVIDLSKEDVNARLAYLKDHGKPFRTLIYIPGHTMLYIGNAVVNGQNVPMTYQDLWGLRPKNGKSRSIVGGSVFFPLLAAYPEDPDLVSLAGKAQFKLGFIE